MKLTTNRRTKTTHTFTFKDISCEIVFWTCDEMKQDKETYRSGGIYNSYLTFSKLRNPELFEKYNVKISKKNKQRVWNHRKATEDIEMKEGISYYNKEYHMGDVMCVKVGNTYRNQWKPGKDPFNKIEKDLKKTINKIIK